MTPFPAPAPTVTVRTRQQLDVLLENIAELQHQRADLLAAQEMEIAAVRHRYRAPLTEVETFLHAETSWAETWAQANPGALAADRTSSARTLNHAHVTLGFRAAPPQIHRASRRWTWTRIASALAELTWGKRYLRIPAPEVDKDAIAADLARLSPTDLRAAGMIATQGEMFFIEPHHADATYQEAA